jgi:hypothetical protein
MLRDLKPFATIDYVDGGMWIVCGCGEPIIELRLGGRWPSIVEAMTGHECPEEARSRKR